MSWLPRGRQIRILHRETGRGPLGWLAPSCLTPSCWSPFSMGYIPNKYPLDIRCIWGWVLGALHPKVFPTIFPMNHFCSTLWYHGIGPLIRSSNKKLPWWPVRTAHPGTAGYGLWNPRRWNAQNIEWAGFQSETHPKTENVDGYLKEVWTRNFFLVTKFLNMRENRCLENRIDA